MAEEMTNVPQFTPVVAPPASTPEVSAWQRLGQQTRNTRPVTVARYALVIGALAALVWLANTAWQSLVPFVVGGFIAYAVLPFVNRLDRIMPRWFASLIVVVGVLAFIVLFIATLVPLILQQVLVLINSLPKADQLQQSTAQINQSLTTLPEPLRVAVRQMLDETRLSFRAQIDQFIMTLPQVTVQAVLGLLNTLSAVLGLLVLPTWLLIVLKDGKQAVREINKLVPARARLDFWSIVRIADRSLRAFLQQQVTQAFLVGAAMAVVALLLDRVGCGRREVSAGRRADHRRARVDSRDRPHHRLHPANLGRRVERGGTDRDHIRGGVFLDPQVRRAIRRGAGRHVRQGAARRRDGAAGHHAQPGRFCVRACCQCPLSCCRAIFSATSTGA